MKIFLVCLLSTILILSCKSINKEVNKSLTENEHEKINRTQLLENLKRKHNVSFIWDTINYRFSYNHKGLFNNNNQLIIDYYIHDIYEDDNKYYLFTSVYGERVYFLKLEVNENQLEHIFSNFHLIGDEKNESLLIVNVSYIKKIDASIYNNNCEDESILTFRIATQEYFYGIGYLVEYIIL